jgi:hypothetical protein
MQGDAACISLCTNSFCIPGSMPIVALDSLLYPVVHSRGLHLGPNNCHGLDRRCEALDVHQAKASPWNDRVIRMNSRLLLSRAASPSSRPVSSVKRIRAITRAKRSRPTRSKFIKLKSCFLWISLSYSQTYYRPQLRMALGKGFIFAVR